MRNSFLNLYMVYDLRRTYILSHSIFPFSWRDWREGLNDMLRDIQLIVRLKLMIESSNPNSPFISSQDKSRKYVHLWRGCSFLDHEVLSVSDMSRCDTWGQFPGRHCAHGRPGPQSLASWTRDKRDSSLGITLHLYLLTLIQTPSETSLPCPLSCENWDK